MLYNLPSILISVDTFCKTLKDDGRNDNVEDGAWR